MTDSKALIERLRKWPMREQVQTYDHTFHIAETGSSYTTKQVIPQSPKPVMHEAADHIEKLEAELMDTQADNAIGIARIAELEADNARLREVLEPFARAQHIVASVDGERIRCILTYPPEAKQTFTLASLNEARAALQETSHAD